MPLLLITFITTNRKTTKSTQGHRSGRRRVPAAHNSLHRWPNLGFMCSKVCNTARRGLRSERAHSLPSINICPARSEVSRRAGPYLFLI